MTRSKAWDRDDRRTVHFYTRRLAQFKDHRALDWGSRESQVLRFSVLSLIGDLQGRRLLDVGCGTGDLAGWLEGLGIRVEYLGIDLTPAMIERARELRPAQQFEEADLLDPRWRKGERWDFVLASGLFAHRQHQPFVFLQKMVEAMFARSVRGCAFNSLSSWAPSRDRGEFYADPQKTLAFCARLTPNLSLRHDYHPRDFTLYLHPESAP